MDLNTLIASTAEAKRELEHILYYKDLELIQNTGQNPYTVCFNGFTTVDGFEDEVLFTHLAKLEELIELRSNIELDDVKKFTLVERIINSIQSNEEYCSKSYIETRDKLDPVEQIFLKEFEDSQIQHRTLVVELLQQKFLNNSVSNKPLVPILWKLPATELAWLFWHLEEKGYIAPTRSRTAFFHTLSKLFIVPTNEHLEKNLTRYFAEKYKKHSIFKVIPPYDAKIKD